MNLKRLEQLVRLANNNPNDNEANLAARKVCKLIEEGGFKFAEDIPLRGKSPVQSGPRWQYDSFWTDFARGQWNQPRPERSPWWNEPQPRYDPNPPPPKPPPYKEDENKYEWYTDSNGQQRKRIKADYKRTIKCTQCKKEYITGFVGHTATFICTTCQWINFQKEHRE